MRETIILKDVFVIADGDESRKARWTRIGVGFVNSDESINIILDAVPTNGRLHVRDRRVRPSQTDNKERN